MKIIGGFIAGVAALLLVYALTMSTTVSTTLGEIHNVGLMDRKQTLLILSIAFLIIGLGIVGACILTEGNAQNTTLDQPQRKCPECAEQIRAEAKRCKHCGADVEPTIQECDFCGLAITKPIDPCSAFGRTEIRQSIDRVKSSSCLNALARANVIDRDYSSEAPHTT